MQYERRNHLAHIVLAVTWWTLPALPLDRAPLAAQTPSAATRLSCFTVSRVRAHLSNRG